MRDDLISRKALLNVVGKIPQSWEYGQAISDVYDIIKSAPTLTLDDLRPKGNWVVERKHSHGKFSHCSGCLTVQLTADTKKLHYCSHCGADMRGGGEGA